MKISLYKCKDDRKKIVKKPAPIVENVLIRLKEPTNIMNPVITMSKVSIGEKWSTVNYAFIPEFKRYYFVDSIECLNDGLLSLSLTVDVLYTYSDDLLRTRFEIARSEKINNSYFIDTEKALRGRRVVKYLPIGTGGIPQSATGNKYTITVAGGF